MNPVDKYVRLLSELICSQVSFRVIVRKIRQIESEEEAIVFFGKATDCPDIGRFFFYSIEEKRKAILEMQDYLKEIGIEVPVPPDSVQGFLAGGEYQEETH